jgi:PAS domain S-box-containing protein
MTIDASLLSTIGPHPSVPLPLSNFKICLETLQWLGEHFSVAIALLDQELKFVYVNRAWRNCWPVWSSDSDDAFPMQQLPQSWQTHINQGLLGVHSTTAAYPLETESDGACRLMQLEIIPLPQPVGNGMILVQIVIHSNITSDCLLNPGEAYQEQYQTEIALAESETKYRQLVEQLDDVIFSVTGEGTFSYISPRCQAILGYSPKHFLGQPYQRFIHPEDWRQCQVLLGESLAQEQRIRDLGFRMKHKDGGWRWICCNQSPTKDALGNIIGFQGVATDIHEQKLAEAKHLEIETALLQSEKLLQNLTEHVPGMLFQVHTTAAGAMQFTYVSSGCRELYGFEPAAILHNSQLVLEAVHPEDRVSILEAMAYATKDSHSPLCWQWKGRLLSPSGQTKWVQSFAKSELQPNGDTLWHGFTFDVSEQQSTQQKQEEVEAALQRSEARLSTLINTAPMILYAFNCNGEFTFSEGKGLELLGFKPGEVVGQSIFDLYCDSPDIVTNIKGAITGEINNFVTLLEGRYYETFFNPIYDDLGHITEVIAAAVDVTEQRQTELERQRALITEERNRMAREIHDTLAQALTGIFIQLGAASRLLAQDPDAAQQHIEHARVVARSGVAEARRSVEALRSQLLEEGDLYKALSQLVQQLSTLTDAEVSLILPENLDRFPADIENNLLRIVQEAMTNCIRHSFANKIIVKLDSLPEAYRLQIRDDGQGFEVDVKNHNSYGILGMHERSVCIGAELEIQSNIGKGTTVTVQIPLHCLEEGV